MSIHLQREIDTLNKRLLSLCAVVEDQVQSDIQALLDRNAQLAHDVERRDADVDHREIEVEEECLKLLALCQPVAVDLRLIVAALKINNDLERIGDLAVNIARKAAAIADEPPMEIPFDIAGMWEKTQA
jgi:phosphate transport system protein